MGKSAKKAKEAIESLIDGYETANQEKFSVSAQLMATLQERGSSFTSRRLPDPRGLAHNC